MSVASEMFTLVFLFLLLFYNIQAIDNMCYIVSLKTGHQNIQGGGVSKLKHDDLINKVKSHHIFGTQETKLGKENAAPDIEGYVKYRSDRSKKSKRESGGSLVYIKKITLIHIFTL